MKVEATPPQQDPVVRNAPTEIRDEVKWQGWVAGNDLYRNGNDYQSDTKHTDSTLSLSFSLFIFGVLKNDSTSQIKRNRHPSN